MVIQPIGDLPERSRGFPDVVEGPVGDAPFARHGTPIRVIARGRQVPAWRAEDGAADPLPQSPVASGEAEREIELIPYAAAKLRITAFPSLKS